MKSSVGNLSEVIVFRDQSIQVVRQPRRKSMTLKIRPDASVQIIVNNGVSESIMRAFIFAKSNWIERKTEKLKQDLSKCPLPKIENGSFFPWIGELKCFQFVETKNKKISFTVEDGFLICRVPKDEKPTDEILKSKLRHFYKLEAMKYLTSHIWLRSENTGLKPNKIIFRSARTRWGSCSSQKQISLNWKLICQPAPLIDYVIVHELCHLKFLNHSSNFWNLVERIIPNYLESERLLQSQVQFGKFLD